MSPPRTALRDQLAGRWGIPPWLVDEAPAGEVEAALKKMRIETQVRRAFGGRLPAIDGPPKPRSR